MCITPYLAVVGGGAARFLSSLLAPYRYRCAKRLQQRHLFSNEREYFDFFCGCHDNDPQDALSAEFRCDTSDKEVRGSEMPCSAQLEAIGPAGMPMLVEVLRGSLKRVVEGADKNLVGSISPSISPRWCSG